MKGLHCTLPPSFIIVLLPQRGAWQAQLEIQLFHENFLAVAPEASEACGASLTRPPHPAFSPGPPDPAHLTRPTLRQADGHVHSRVSAPPRSRQKLYINRSKISRDKIALFCPRVSVGALWTPSCLVHASYPYFSHYEG